MKLKIFGPKKKQSFTNAMYTKILANVTKVY